MKVYSEPVVQSFKPIRVTIVLESADDMRTIEKVLKNARTLPLLPVEVDLVKKLLPAFQSL